MKRLAPLAGPASEAGGRAAMSAAAAGTMNGDGTALAAGERTMSGVGMKPVRAVADPVAGERTTSGVGAEPVPGSVRLVGREAGERR